MKQSYQLYPPGTELYVVQEIKSSGFKAWSVTQEIVTGACIEANKEIYYFKNCDDVSADLVFEEFKEAMALVTKNIEAQMQRLRNIEKNRT